MHMVEWLAANPGTYYAHNGGKFDFWFIAELVDTQHIKVVNGRIATINVGESRLIDSFLLAPFALDRYVKMEIDYQKFVSEAREKHRDEILEYLHSDCVNLYNLVAGFHATLGKHLTIGGAAFARLKSIGIEPTRGNAQHDNQFRPFYFGGRTQAFRTGYWPKIKADYLDINSAYPWAMTEPHPWGLDYTFRKSLPKRKLAQSFIIFEGRSIGALPVRDDAEQRIRYDDEVGTFYTTGHELIAGLDTDSIEIHKVRAVYVPKKTINFSGYVLHLFELKAQAKANRDKVSELAYKFLLNSCYGKFATNPETFKEYQIIEWDDALPVPWFFEGDIGERLSIWSRPSYRISSGYYDVAVAASITGQVRAYLWRTICSGQPYYCDTDSIIGQNYHLEESDKLGQWKVEGRVKELAIAGRKLYAARVIEDGRELWKVACKGGILSAKEIVQVSQGQQIIYNQDAPTYSLSGARFVSRTFRKT